MKGHKPSLVWTQSPKNTHNNRLCYFKNQRLWVKEPCSNGRDTTTPGGCPARDGVGSIWLREHSPNALLLEAAAASGASKAGIGAGQGPQAGGANKTVRRPTAEIPRPKNPCPRPVAAAHPRRSEAKRLAAAVPRAASPTLERLHAAQERLSLGHNPSSPSEPTRRMGEAAASLELSPRPSVRRPRKVSL